MSISGGVGHFDLDQMMEQDMEVHHREVSAPVTALNTMADSLPGLGIVAAVLGVVITMGALGGPPEEIGHRWPQLWWYIFGHFVVLRACSDP